MESIQTVVPGEAPESDDEESTGKIEPTADKPVLPTKAVVVSGEASESDDEDTPTQDLPPLNVDKDSKGDEDLILVNTSSVPGMERAHLIGHGMSKYDSLLHRKLRERNIALRRHIVDSTHQAYTSSSKDLYNIRLQLHKTQGYLQDVSDTISHLSNDLFKLDAKLDTVSTCSILPTIN